MHRALFFLGSLFALAFLAFFFFGKDRLFSEPEENAWDNTRNDVPIKNDFSEIPTTAKPTEVPEKSTSDSDSRSPAAFSKSPLLMDFASQAPSGDWSDPIFQDGCEEASLTMVVSFLKNTPLDALRMKQEIVIFSQYLKKTFGTSTDLALSDVPEVLSSYYGISRSQYREKVSLGELKAFLEQGNILLVQADGRKLKNSYYTPPGPERHMLVLLGYDRETGEVITHDPGTRHGKGYRYQLNTLFDALREYRTGDHLPILETKKSVVIISPEMSGDRKS